MCGPRPKRLPRPHRGQRKAAGDPSPAHRRAHRPPFSPPSPRRGRAGPPALRRSSALTGHAPVPTAGLGAAHPAGVGPNRTAALRLPPRGPAASPRILHPLLQPRRAPRPPRKDRAAPSPALRSIPPPIATWAQRSAGPYLRVPPPAECRLPQPPPAVIRAEGPRLPFGAGAAGGAGSGTASVLAPRARSAPRVAAAPVRPGTYRPERKARLDGVRGERRGRPSVRAGPREAPSAAPGGGASPGINRPDFVLFGRGASLIHQSVSGCPQPELEGGFSEKPLCCPVVAYPRGWRMRRPRAAPAAGCAALRPNGRRARNRGLRAGTAGGEGPRAAPTWSRARPSWSHKMVRVGRNPPKPSGPALNGDTRGSMSAQSPPA